MTIHEGLKRYTERSRYSHRATTNKAWEKSHTEQQAEDFQKLHVEAEITACRSICLP